MSSGRGTEVRPRCQLCAESCSSAVLTVGVVWTGEDDCCCCAAVYRARGEKVLAQKDQVDQRERVGGCWDCSVTSGSGMAMVREVLGWECWMRKRLIALRSNVVNWPCGSVQYYQTSDLCRNRRSSPLVVQDHTLLLLLKVSPRLPRRMLQVVIIKLFA